MKTASLVTLASCVLCSLAGCLDNNAGEGHGVLECAAANPLYTVRSFQRVDTMSMCRADTTNMSIWPFGTLDVGFLEQLHAAGVDITELGYWAAPVLVNNLVDTSTPTTPQRGQIQTTGFNVEITAETGQTLPIKTPSPFFAHAAGGLINPGGGLGAMFVKVLPADIALSLASAVNNPTLPNFHNRIIVHVQPVGIRAGETILGACTTYPIDLCKNCLTNVQDCPQGGFAPTSVVSGGCRVQQDDAVTCCKDTSSPDKPVVLCGSQVPKGT